MNLALLSLLSVLSAADPDEPVDPLCVGRAPCSLQETLDAGKDARGHALEVKHLDLGWLESTSQSASGRKFGAGRKPEGKTSDGQCQAEEWWLLGSGKAPQLLLATCNDGYGMAGSGEDVVQVSKNHLEHRRYGGADLRWIRANTFQLSPLRQVAREDTDYVASDPSSTTVKTWDVLKFKGALASVQPTCGGDEGKAPPGKVYAQRDVGAPLLPRVELDKAYLQEGWKQTALGACALEASAFVLGKARSPQDAALKVLLVAPDTLVLEVRDDHWTGPSDQWLADDHVELWLDSSGPVELNQCTPPTAEQQPEQWAIRIADGKVFPAYGSPKGTLQVEKAEIREAGALVGYRLKVVLPQKFESLGVLYSDSDSGKKQERLLGTSAVKFARPETLNAVMPVDPGQVTCEVHDGVLTVKPSVLESKSPDIALLPM